LSHQEDNDNMQFKEKLNMSLLFMRQIERCNMASPGMDETIYQANVRRLMDSLPSYYRDRVLERDDDYNSTIVSFTPRKFCGHEIGSRNKPKTTGDVPVKRLEDGSVDWTDPNIFSPTRSEYTDTDYEKLHSIILEEAEIGGLTWSTEPINKVALLHDRVKRIATPYRKPVPEEEPEEDAEKEPEYILKDPETDVESNDE